ncbi:hypothetical protein RSP03_23470 [Cereibacter sphaeroides]|nr:hypothetical protein RSP03_23470 [Cereibacter sphaeroides]
MLLGGGAGMGEAPGQEGAEMRLKQILTLAQKTHGENQVLRRARHEFIGDAPRGGFGREGGNLTGWHALSPHCPLPSA